ncbi:MAG: hypothetical protein K9K67_06855 [Bacteriovoracaceae bacterium]|nr:hypothetical protein [Bacteriovoracaceae bacterium]
MKTYFWPILVTLSLLLFGCGETKDEVKPSIGDALVESLVLEADELAFQMDTGRFLRNASIRDRGQVRGTIERVKVSSVLLDANPYDRSALMSLKTAFKFFQNIVITERDQPRIDRVLNIASTLMVKYAAIQGVALDDLQWEIFSYRFSNGLAPFGSPDIPNFWSIRFVQQERYAINVRGENKTATLMSPTFDLTKALNPGYSLRHSFQVEEHFLPRDFFNRSDILNNAFRVFATEHYKETDEPFKLVTVSGSTINEYQRFLVTDNGLIEDGSITSEVAKKESYPTCSPTVRPEEASQCMTAITPTNRIISKVINLPAKNSLSLALRHRLSSQNENEGARIKIAEVMSTDSAQIDFEKLEWTSITPAKTSKKIWEKQDQFFFDIPAKFSGKKIVLAFEMSSKTPSTTWDLYYAALSARNAGEGWSRVWRNDFSRFGIKDFTEQSIGSPSSKFTSYEASLSNIDEERLWKRVNLGKLPLGLNFNTVDSGINSLEEFAGKKVTMAFVFQNNGALGNHILSWSIERFELYGVVENLTYVARPQPFDPNAQDNLGKPVWRQNFAEDLLGDLEQVTLQGNPAEFRGEEYNGDKYVRGGDINTEGTKLLYSAPIDLKDTLAPAVRIDHSIKFYEGIYQDEHDLRLVIAEEVPGMDIKDLNWIRVNFELNNPPGDNRNRYKSEFVLIPEALRNKNIRIGWSHRSRDKSSPAWQIFDTEVRDIPELLE